MPETRTCFVCGKSHERSSRVCAECAAAYGPDRPFAPLPELPANAVQSVVPTPTGNIDLPVGEPSVPTPGWDDDIFAPPVAPLPPAPPRGIPIPPQLQPTPSDTSAEKPAAAKEAVPETVRCGECGKPAEPGFSFCTGCGADLPGAAAVPKGKNVPVSQGERLHENEAEPVGDLSETVTQGIRDTRARVRRIAEAYDNAVAAAGNEVRGGQRQMQRPVEHNDAGEHDEAQAAKPVSPFAHGVLSFFFPGVGQILNGQPGKGFLLIVAGFVSVMAWGLGPWAIPIVVARMLVALDAYRIASRRLAGDAIDPNEWDLT
ncbi:MAG: hypothetical protein ACOVT5_00845 [Armatimonadaceae bacterium]